MPWIDKWGVARMNHRMSGPGIQLHALGVEDEAAFRAAVAENRTSEPDWPFAFSFDESTDFAAYVDQLNGWARGEGLPDGFVSNTYLVGVVGGVIVGRISIRHRLNDFLARVGGHIGYGVIPSQRGRGFATEMLRQALPIAAGLGLSRVLVTCDDDNFASARVIEKNGGVYEGLNDDPDLPIAKRRYWIELSDLA